MDFLLVLMIISVLLGTLRASLPSHTRLFELSSSSHNQLSPFQGTLANPISRGLVTNTGKEAMAPLPLKTWHRRLGHLNNEDIRILAQNTATGIQLHNENTANSICVPCLRGKQHLAINRNPSDRPERIGSLIHLDMCGPIGTASHSTSSSMLMIGVDISGFIL